MTPEKFYAAVAVLLDTNHTFMPIVDRGDVKRRWGPREPGNGRFPGYGIVRLFGSQIHIALHTPPLSKVADSMNQALTLIGTAVLADIFK